MRSISPVSVLICGIVILILLLNERARFVAALIVFVIDLLAAAEVFGVDLRFWR